MSSDNSNRNGTERHNNQPPTLTVEHNLAEREQQSTQAKNRGKVLSSVKAKRNSNQSKWTLKAKDHRCQAAILMEPSNTTTSLLL